MALYTEYFFVNGDNKNKSETIEYTGKQSYKVLGLFCDNNFGIGISFLSLMSWSYKWTNIPIIFNADCLGFLLGPLYRKIKIERAEVVDLI